MSNATQSLAGTRITSLLDANSFVEIGQSVTARNTDFNMTEKKSTFRRCYYRIWCNRWKSGVCVQPGCFRTERNSW